VCVNTVTAKSDVGDLQKGLGLEWHTGGDSITTSDA
jgi:hypothetical protein